MKRPVPWSDDDEDDSSNESSSSSSHSDSEADNRTDKTKARGPAKPGQPSKEKKSQGILLQCLFHSLMHCVRQYLEVFSSEFCAMSLDEL